MQVSSSMFNVIVFGILLLFLYYYVFCGQPIHNKGVLQMKRSTDRQYREGYEGNSDALTYNGLSEESSDSASDSASDNMTDNMSDNMSDNTPDTMTDTMTDNAPDNVPDNVSDTDNVPEYTYGMTDGAKRTEKPNVKVHVNKNQADMDDCIDSSLEIIRERTMGMNGPYYRRKNGNKYRHNSYRALGNGTDLKQVDKQFKVEDVTKNYTDRFVPVSASDDQEATVNIKNNKGDGTNKHDVDAFLPKEKDDDWFETIETVDVKNSHLINTYRPIGANTIGTSHKGAIYDLRGLDKAVCPKFVVSPWLQSSWEPDRSSKSLCA